jgi:hypothetical protein
VTGKIYNRNPGSQEKKENMGAPDWAVYKDDVLQISCHDPGPIH